jgi:hypothetical protein
MQRWNTGSQIRSPFADWTVEWVTLASPSPRPSPRGRCVFSGIAGRASGARTLVRREAGWRRCLEIFKPGSGLPTFLRDKSRAPGEFSIGSLNRYLGRGRIPIRNRDCLSITLVPEFAQHASARHHTDAWCSLSLVCVYGSADFQSAVSPICNRQSVGSVPRAGSPRGLAECNSAIQQATGLRYGLWQHGERILSLGERVRVRGKFLLQHAKRSTPWRLRGLLRSHIMYSYATRRRHC